MTTVANLYGKHIEIVTNSHGMRWREVALESPVGKQRIAFVGDSFTFGEWASSIHHAFPSVFENDIDKDRYEVLNFGVPGYSFEDIEKILREEVVRFDVDHVILASFNGNDWRELWLGTKRSRVVDGAVVGEREVWQQSIELSFWRSSWLGKNSALYRYGRGALRYQQAKRFPAVRRQFRGEPEDIMRSPYWSQAEYDERGKKTVEQAYRILGRIAKLCRDIDAKLYLVALPTREQVYAKSMVGKDYSLKFPQEYLRRFADEHDIPYLDMLPILRAADKDEPKDFYALMDGHFNDMGHRLTGESVGQLFRAATVRSAQTAPHGSEIRADRRFEPPPYLGSRPGAKRG